MRALSCALAIQCDRNRNGALMPQAALEIVGVHHKLDALPLHLTQRFSRTSAVARLTLLVPAILLVLVPVGFFSFSTGAMAQLTAQPGDALLAGVGVALFCCLFGLPFSRAIKALVSQRTVTIEAGAVTVEDRGLFGLSTWTLPLSAYRGVAHVVRTSLSGARHELVLVHPSRSRRILLCTSDKLSETDLDQASRLLSLPLVPANDLYRWPSLAAKPVQMRHHLEAA
jgi:hypothetical protein